MTVNDPKHLSELIRAHHQNFKGIYQVYNTQLCNIKKGYVDDNESVENSSFNMKFFCFLEASYLDLLVSYRGLKISETEWEIIHHCKSAYLTIYESINWYNSHGKNIHSLVQSNQEDLATFKKNISKNLKKFKKDFKYEKTIKETRHSTSAHFDKDITQYFETVQKLDKKTTLNAIEHFLGLLKAMMHFLQFVIDEEISRWDDKT